MQQLSGSRCQRGTAGGRGRRSAPLAPGPRALSRPCSSVEASGRTTLVCSSSSSRSAGATAAAPAPIAAARRAPGPAGRPVRASKLDELSLFADSSLLGPGKAGGSGSAAAGPSGIDDVPLDSKLGLDYKPLQQYLKEGDFRKADDETRAMLIKQAGAGAVARGWVYFSEVKTIPSEDLRTVDALWKAASKGKFGFSVQRELFIQAAKRWPKFFKQIDWVVGENNVYRKWPAEFIYSLDAAKGHLPLTNALRGTQLFEELLKHPAFEPAAKGAGIDEKAKAAGANTLKF